MARKYQRASIANTKHRSSTSTVNVIAAAHGKAFAAGWNDILAGRPFAPNYEFSNWEGHSYEMGRLYAAEAQAANRKRGFLLPWSTRPYSEFPQHVLSTIRGLSNVWPEPEALSSTIQAAPRSTY